MPPDDVTRVRHMIEAAEAVQTLVAGQDRAGLGDDLKLQLALVRAIEIIGEAAAGVSRELQSRHPGIPWREAVAMRNRLVHAYFDVNLDIVWKTATQEVPALLTQLRGLEL